MTNNDQQRWKDLEQAFYQPQLTTTHVHKFEQSMSADLANDDVYYYGRCDCGETEI